MANAHWLNNEPTVQVSGTRPNARLNDVVGQVSVVFVRYGRATKAS